MNLFKPSQPLNKHSGVALIQVLLISSIISILAISFTYTAREQIAVSTAFEQRIKAVQKIKSVQSQIIYELLTQPNSFADKQNQLEQQNTSWNFHGRPFFINSADDSKIVVSIQDIKGLLSQRYPKTPFWQLLLNNMEFDDEQVKQKQGLLSGWQDKDNDSWILGESEPESTESGTKYPNQPIQLPHEIDLFFIDDREKLGTIKKVTTHYSNSKFNPMNAPDSLLNLLFEPELAEFIIEQRALKQLTSQQMQENLGDLYDTEIINMYRGNKLTITVLVISGAVQIQESIDILLQPYDTTAVQVIARY